MQEIYQKLIEVEENGESAALCIITKTKGSTPLKVGAKMIVLETGNIVGTIGGGTLEYQVIKDAIAVIKNNVSKTVEFNLVQDLQMCCGGSLEIYIEPIMQKNRLIIMGAGHIGKQVASYAKNLHFQISLVDEREEIINSIQINNITKFNIPHNKYLSSLTFNSKTYIVICTHLHDYDREILAYCINKPYAYLGMIGSKRKVLVTRKLFQKNNIASNEALDKVDMPMGLNIGGENVSEIALSIVAKIVAVKNNVSFNKSEQKIINYEEENCDSNGCW